MNNIDQTSGHFSDNNSGFVLDKESYNINDSLFSSNNQSSLYNSANYLELVPYEKTNTLNNQIEELVFIDSKVADSQTLIDNLSGAAEVVVLDSNTDGLLQINNALNQHQDIDAVHIVSHGDAGQLSLGNTQIDRNNLFQYAEILADWDESLTEDADVLLYGCDIASNREGIAFLNQFSQLTNADILASNDATGSNVLHGDWNLEVAIGDVETEIAFDSTVDDAYEHILNTAFSPDSLTLGFADIIIDSGSFGDGFSDFDDFLNIDGDRVTFTPDELLNFPENFTPPVPDSIDSDGTINYETEKDGEIIIVETDFTAYEPVEEVYNFLNDPSDFYFDDGFYINSYPELANTGVDPFNHFMSTGWKEGKNPSRYFNTSFYLYSNPDVADSGMNPFEHFQSSGWKEMRDPSAYFDTSYYLESEANRDVLEANINPLEHFQNTGWREGRDPNQYFDTKFYLASNLDVKAADLNPLEHYISSGADEGRLPSLFFDGDYYLEKNIDVAASGMNPLEHYLTSGQTEERKSSEFFENNPKMGFSYDLFNREEVQKINQSIESTNYSVDELAANPNLIPNSVKDALESKGFLVASSDETNIPLWSLLKAIVGTADDFLNQKVGPFLEGVTISFMNSAVIQNINSIEIDVSPEALGLGLATIQPKLLIPLGEDAIFYEEYLRYNYGTFSPSFPLTLPQEEVYGPTLPFPGEEAGRIKVETFPGGISNPQELEDYIFSNPVDSEIEFSGVSVYSRDEILERLLNEPLIFPDGNVNNGFHVLSIDKDGNLIGYNPYIAGNVSLSQWNERLQRPEGEPILLDSFTNAKLPYRIPNEEMDRRGEDRESTYGLFSDTVNGVDIRLKSGYFGVSSSRKLRSNIDNLGLNPTEKNAVDISLGHAEGHAAAIMREYGMSYGRIYINHNEGPCRFCDNTEEGYGIQNILNPGQKLDVHWSSDGGTTFNKKTFTGQ